MISVKVEAVIVFVKLLAIAYHSPLLYIAYVL